VESDIYEGMGTGGKSLRKQCFDRFCADALGKGEKVRNGGKQMRIWLGNAPIPDTVSIMGRVPIWA
jgi:hypothetical protein